MTTMSVPAAAGQSAQADERRRQGLRRMRLLATSLLAVAALVYVFTRDRHGFLGYVNAGAEAAMVGAIADWFAVTALFRHPLSIPVPHTALIPRKKDSLAASLQDFVADNFLREDVVRERIGQADPARRIGRWLTKDHHAQRVVDEAAKVLADGLDHIDHDDVAAVITEMIVPRMIEEPLSPAIGQLLGEVIDEGAHVGLVDLTLDELSGWLSRHPDRIIGLVKQRAPSWSPDWANRLVADRLFGEAVSWIDDIRRDRTHDVRLALDHWLRELATDLQHDAETMARAERLKERLLTQPKATTTAIRLWDSFRKGLIEALSEPTGLLRTRAVSELEALGERLQSDGQLAERVSTTIADIAAYAVDHYGSEVATIISATVERWDGKETAERIELHVGRDLQFIRINGTVVGGLAGVVIHAISSLV